MRDAIEMASHNNFVAKKLEVTFIAGTAYQRSRGLVP
jgi:hypothetical protein